MKSIAPQQRRFAEEYLVDLNATRAAHRAGYSDPSYGRQLINLPGVRAEIRRLQDARSQRARIDADDVFNALADIGFADIRELFHWDEERAAFMPALGLTRRQAAAIQSIKAHTVTRGKGKTAISETRLEIRLHPKIPALVELGKHLGIAQKHEVSGPDGTLIPVKPVLQRAEELLDAIATRRAIKAPTNGG